MGTRLSHAEYWILDLVHEYGEAVHFLGNGHYGNNKRYFEYGVEELREAVGRLAQEGWIVGYFSGLGAVKDIMLTPELIERELLRRDIDYGSWTPEKPEPDPPLVYYKMTVAGGGVWEEFAYPQWERFIEGIGYLEAEPPEFPRGRGEAACASKKWLEDYLKGAHVEGVVIDFATLTWSEERPWRATYWKTLEVGYRARFEARLERAVPMREWPWLHRFYHEWKGEP
jgi:hypothetical protein